jgi:hypothetical protein
MIMKGIILFILFLTITAFLISYGYSEQGRSFYPHQTEDTLHYDGGNWSALMIGSHYYAAVRFTPTFAGTLCAIIFYHGDSFQQSGTLSIHKDSLVGFPGSVLMSVPFVITGESWHRINLPSPHVYIENVDFWTVLKVFYGGVRYPVGIDSGPHAHLHGDWVSLNYGQTWDELYMYAYDNNWNIRAIVHQEGSGFKEEQVLVPAQTQYCYPSIISGQLPFPQDNRSYRILDITGRQIHTLDPAPGIYFIEVDGEIRQKVVKVR